MNYNINTRSETKVRNIEINTDSKFTNNQNTNKNIIKNLANKIETLESKINSLESSLQVLRNQYEENNKKLNDLLPVVGKKRKRFWIGF